MPQLGILFDSQKLGSGFYGYTAFRILFTTMPSRELAGCTLYHGEVGDGRSRPYCISIESESVGLLSHVRHTFSSSMARGLMPVNGRFLDESGLQEEVLALAAHVTSTGEMTDCHSRWLQEAWQRAQGQASLGTPEPRPPAIATSPTHAPAPVVSVPMPHPARPIPDARVVVNLPEAVPLAMRCSVSGRKALAFLVAFSLGGALVPWVGWGVALSAMMFFAGALQGLAIRWRLWAEEDLSGPDVLQEAKKLLAAKPIHEVAERLCAAGPQASPLLRRVYSSTRATDLSGACLLAGQHERADMENLLADSSEIRTQGWGVAGVALCAVAAIAVFQGTEPALAQAPRLALVGLSGCLVLLWMANLLAVRGRRLEVEVRRELASSWLPALVRAMPGPKTQSESLDHSFHELSQEFQAMRMALERRRDADFVDVMGDLRAAIDQLKPVLDGFREPFVLQAVPAPAPRPKAMSATA